MRQLLKDNGLPDELHTALERPPFKIKSIKQLANYAVDLGEAPKPNLPTLPGPQSVPKFRA